MTVPFGGLLSDAPKGEVGPPGACQNRRVCVLFVVQHGERFLALCQCCLFTHDTHALRPPSGSRKGASGFSSHRAHVFLVWLISCISSGRRGTCLYGMEKTLVFVPNLLVPRVAGWVSWTPTQAAVSQQTHGLLCSSAGCMCTAASRRILAVKEACCAFRFEWEDS